MADKLDFRMWFEENGNELLGSWLRAKEDGNDEPFAHWVTGEYDCYLEAGDDFEIAYRGLFDNPSTIECLIFCG